MPAELLICSDLHYASGAEKQRLTYELAAIPSPAQRLLVRFYRHYFWLRDPFGHNNLLDRVLDDSSEPDFAIANGDYSCDSAFIGVTDEAARQSAAECLGKLRGRFGARFRPVFGDHELGKTSVCGGKGGLRLASLRAAQTDLGLKPFWCERVGRYLLVAVTSSLVAMPVYERETLDEERGEWREIARQHLDLIDTLFAQLRPDDKILLFCHDPTALPFLWSLDSVRQHAAQIERTIIGHLHSELILKQSRLMTWMPRITSCGPTVARISTALSKAKDWKHFKVLLCPSLFGVELTRRGGFYRATLDPEGVKSAEFRRQTIRR